MTARGATADGETAPKRSFASVLALLGTAVGLVSGVIGLVLLVRPDLQRDPATADRSATLRLVDLEPRLTRGQYLQRVGLPGDAFTAAQLRERGAFVTYRVAVVGYRHKRLPVTEQLIDARSGDAVSDVQPYEFVPDVDRDTGNWRTFIPLPARRGRFYVLVEVMEPDRIVPLDTLKTGTFGLA